MLCVELAAHNCEDSLKRHNIINMLLPLNHTKHGNITTPASHCAVVIVSKDFHDCWWLYSIKIQGEDQENNR